MKIIYNGIEITGQKTNKVFKNCLHLNVDECLCSIIMNDKNRIWIKLDKTTQELKIVSYPYEIISFDKNFINILED